MSARPSAVVSGIGLVTALGNRETTWAALRAGRSGARILRFPPGSGEPPFAGFPIAEGDDHAPALIARAAASAIDDAGLRPERAGLGSDPDRVGVVVGFSKGDLRTLSKSAAESGFQGRDFLRAWPSGPAAGLAEDYDLRGPNLAPVAACATGVVAVLRAADLIRRGDCDLVLAGAGDSPLEPLVLSALRNMKALARVEGDPTAALRPLDRARSGFLPGSGAAILVVERREHAEARGATAYAEILGGAIGSDAFHLTNVNPDPAPLAALISRALADAGIEPLDVHHVNLHGTGTIPNDPVECRAIRRALDDLAANRLACSANKAQIGHLLGAAGAVELSIACLTLRDGFIPPTLNLRDPDPACDLDATPLVGRRLAVEVALKLAVGFGGHQAAAILRRPEAGSRFERATRF